MNEPAPDLVLPTLARGVQSAVPLLLAANGELIAERAGLLNIGIEGTMLTGAFVGAAVAWATGSAVAGLATALAAGALIGLLFAAWTVFARRDQIVTGLALNLLAVGFTGVAVQRIDRAVGASGAAFIPPGLGDAGVDGMLIASVGLIGLTHLWLACTRPGLTVRAVGENPEAADTVGVRVTVVRTLAAVAGCALPAAAGAYLSLGITTRFQEEMTGGRGFLALALVIFGRWSPLRVLVAALFFGCLDALQVTLQPALGPRVHLLYPALLALPYVLTLVALAGLAGRAHPPAALAVPYQRPR